MPGKHQHFQEPEVGCCGKYFLFGFNIVFWVLGALFLAIGLWAWGEKGVLSNISALTDLGGLDPVWLFVVVGGVMSVLGFAGCIGALRENTFLLKFFSVFLGLIFFLELATGILAFVFKDWIRDQLNLFINNNVKAYRDDIDLQNLIDFAQEYWSCCGARGPNDWNFNIYFNCTDLNPSRERCGVPFSCCVRDPAEDVLNTQCGYDVRLKLELEQQGFIHTKGCVGQFEKWLQDNLIVVAGVFMGIALLQVPLWPHVPLPLLGLPSLSPHLPSVLQIFGICLAQNLVSDIKAVKANWSKWNDDFENHWLTPTISEVLSTAGPQQNSLIGAPGLAPPSRHVFFGLGGLYPEPTFKNW
ncbi:tetraspanin-17 isoform X1 [Gorilla gorilla gorilla]|uniref:tetraspanin-17 isoform X1 n=1 Tax=Gorilla gorilla gorilla TaxID=9595 RepID=UPI0024463142|nr:tetraspanin-17 isoform X1 [Gorilla gorilla gorilla]